MPVTGADRIDGVGIGILGVGAQNRFRASRPESSGGDLEDIMIDGLGVGSGRDVRGIGVGGPGIGSRGSLRGGSVGGLAPEAEPIWWGVVLGAGASGDASGLLVGGLSEHSPGTCVLPVVNVHRNG
jgi:hypothetical protein